MSENLKSNGRSLQNRKRENMEQVNITTEAARGVIETKNALERLYANEDFKAVFNEGYFGNEAKRLPLALVDDEMQDEVEQRILNEKIRAIGHLHVYLNSVVSLGRSMEASLVAHEKAQAEANIATEVDEITGETYEVEGN